MVAGLSGGTISAPHLFWELAWQKLPTFYLARNNWEGSASGFYEADPRGVSQFCSPHPKSLSRRERDFERSAPLLLREKRCPELVEGGLGDVGLCASRRVGNRVNLQSRDALDPRVLFREFFNGEMGLSEPWDLSTMAV